MRTFISGDHEFKYVSDNGYSGCMYGISSMRICGPDGKEVFHTHFRAANTVEELREIVDTMPEFLESLNRMMKDYK